MDQELQDAALDLVAMLHEDIAPKAWWGILLCEAVDFLQSEPNSWSFYGYQLDFFWLSRSDTFIFLL